MKKVIFSVIFALFLSTGASTLSFAFGSENVIFELVTEKDKGKKKKKKKDCCASKNAEAEKKNCSGKAEKKSCSGEQKAQ